MLIRYLVLLVSAFHLCSAVWPEYPKNEYEYSLERDQLASAERQFQGKDPMDLSQDEKIVADYLQYLKWEEFQRTRTNFAPFLPIQDVINNITASKVFDVLRQLPKGGNMHTHENHELSKAKLFDIVWASEDFPYLYMAPEHHPTPFMLDFFITPPNDSVAWINVQQENIAKEDIIHHHTLMGILDDYAKGRPTDSAERWTQMSPLWSRAANLIMNVNIKPLYIEALLKQALSEGVTYLETRKNLGPDETLYQLDPDYPENYGRRPVGDADLEVNITMQVLEKIRQEFPEFIDLRRIVYTTRYSSVENVLEAMERVVNLHKQYPNHVIAFDLVGEEDAGNSHIFYLRNYLELYNDETARSEVALKLHTAETNWPDDLITGFNDADPMATLMNTYESIMLGANRIGHGLGFIKHPYLLNIIKERGVAIESCVVSNQILGYMADLRNHPAINFMRNGIPVMLGSDDPGTFGYDYFTIDWYEAFMGWGLDLVDLRTLAIHSLNYSSMSESEKQAAIADKWEPKWVEFITNMRTEACGLDFTQREPIFGSILPREGLIYSATNVHIFGRHFERGICQNIVCEFGDVPSFNAMYVSNFHIICEAPALAAPENTTYSVKISFDNGVSFYDTGKNYTYKFFDPNNAMSLQGSYLLAYILSCFLLLTL